MSLRHSPSSLVRPQVPAPSSASSSVLSSWGVVDSILILRTANSFNKQSHCAKFITEIVKAHFVESRPSFGKVPNKVKNMWYTEFRKRYRWDPMHEHAIRDAWQKRASLRHKDLMYEVQVDGYQPN
ncbi:hypothetical protein M9H77_35044 [Catharanthus roseus]|uniref:Uncharacterized protein n=1 Tax=Catharanthus roseus TaxID=4058 RepID=A0ACB9ZMW8_CATRO|nr:hypothetical protein M9H77_35044 [Catharanthus roseus]